MTETENLCPECGKPVKQAGMRWSGRKRKQSWACRSKTSCGRVTFVPVHVWHNSLFGARSGGSAPAQEPAQEPAENRPAKRFFWSKSIK